MGRITIGVDIGDKKSRICKLSADGKVLEESEIRTSPAGFSAYFKRPERALVAFEIGTHSAWVESLLKDCGHEVIAANPRRLALISESNHKTDRRDALTLAMLAAQSPQLLSPVTQRAPEMRRDLTLLHARSALVEQRTALVNAVRGFVKPTGHRIPATISTHAFHRKAGVHIPADLAPVLSPLLIVIQQLTQQIEHYDREIEQLCAEKYAVTERLRGVLGVGPVTALAFVLIIMDPRRFKKSRQVGAYLGLVPRTYQSGESSPQLRITKSGNVFLRSLLVGSAHYILGHFGDRQDSDLRRYGLALTKRGGKAAKKRAVVAVARKLAVILHHLWVSKEHYEPLRNAKRREPERASA
jgi:transposase